MGGHRDGETEADKDKLRKLKGRQGEKLIILKGPLFIDYIIINVIML